MNQQPSISWRAVDTSITWRALDLPGHFKTRIHTFIEIEIRIEGGPMPFTNWQEIYSGWLKTPFSDWESLGGSGFSSIEEVKSAALIETSKKLHLFSENLKIQAEWEQK